MGIMKRFSFSILETINLFPGLTRVQLFEHCKIDFPAGPIGWSNFKWILREAVVSELVTEKNQDDPGMSTFSLSKSGIEFLE